MDQNQIELVTILRDHGIGYEKIAAMLEVSTITVRRACAKVEKERELTDSQYPVCKECGKKIIYERKTRPRIFCCRKCNQSWWNKRRYTSGRASDDARQCPVCNQTFVVTKNSPQKYCSQECYRKGRYGNHE